jgi:hypothetical protein
MKMSYDRNPQPVFHRLEFEFAPTSDVEFDSEVAGVIAERIAQRDGGRYNHSHASSFQRVYVGIEGMSSTLEAEDERGYSKNLLLPKEVFADPNPIFARGFQRALDEREHDNRMNIPTTIGMFAIVSAIPGATTAAAMSENGLTSDEALLACGIGAGINIFAIGGYHQFRNIYRRVITDAKNTRINEAHIKRAEKLARKLELPPVVSYK